MALPLPVKVIRDTFAAQLNFDWLRENSEEHYFDYVQTNLDLPEMTFGSTQITGDGTNERDVTVTHNLSATPTAVFTAVNDTGSGHVSTPHTLTGSNFQISVRTVGGATWTYTLTLYWLALI